MLLYIDLFIDWIHLCFCILYTLSFQIQNFTYGNLDLFPIEKLAVVGLHSPAIGALIVYNMIQYIFIVPGGKFIWKFILQLLEQLTENFR